MLHGTKRCGRAGPAVAWFAVRDRLTALLDFGRGPLSLRFPRGGRDSRAMLHGTNWCGRAGPAVTWFAAHDRLTALRDFGGVPLSLRLRRGGRDRRTMLCCTKR
jgi:hypothetical protein